MDMSLLFGREGWGMHLEAEHPSELQQLFFLNAMREHIGEILFHLTKRNYLSFTLIFAKPLIH